MREEIGRCGRDAQELRRARIASRLDLFDGLDDEREVDGQSAAAVAPEAAEAELVALGAVAADAGLDGRGVGVVASRPHVEDRLDEARQVALDRALPREDEAARTVVLPVEAHGAHAAAQGLSVLAAGVVRRAGLGQGAPPVVGIAAAVAGV